MASCGITPIRAASACSGKCRGDGCGSKTPRVWVVAACEGMVSLLEKQEDGHLDLLPEEGGGVFASMEAFRDRLVAAESRHELDQLVIVGARADIGWMHMMLPASVAGRVAAEIEYPLVAGWFRQPSHLEQALGHVLSA